MHSSTHRHTPPKPQTTNPQTNLCGTKVLLDLHTLKGETVSAESWQMRYATGATSSIKMALTEAFVIIGPDVFRM